MRAYPWMTERYVRTGLPGARGWCYYYWAVENEATVLGVNWVRKGKGYVAQERERILNG